MLLRRASAGDPPFNTTFAPPILGRADYEQRLMNFQMERDSFRMNMSTAINGVAVGRESLRTVPASAAICEDCLKANTDGIDAAFHLCVLDSVTVGFRSLAGPISRPAKIAGEDGA
ncbi:uncharacterized protein LOC124823513 [Vigna umbellata]|nr:uncharacterized protein LOC124823513 [Vigna umbellata]